MLSADVRFTRKGALFPVAVPDKVWNNLVTLVVMNMTIPISENTRFIFFAAVCSGLKNE